MTAMNVLVPFPQPLHIVKLHHLLHGVNSTALANLKHGMSYVNGHNNATDAHNALVGHTIHQLHLPQRQHQKTQKAADFSVKAKKKNGLSYVLGKIVMVVDNVYQLLGQLALCLQQPIFRYILL